jgi:positive regulator of sigma E activity
MYKEELYEEGIVKESKDGIATIVISDSNNCDECTAKFYCKPGNSNERSLTAKDPFGVHVGDKVRVSIKGGKILFAASLLYGIPLIIVIAAVIIGVQIFISNKELLASLAAVTLVSIYSFIFSYLLKKKKNRVSSFSEIVFVKTQRL